MAISGAGGLIGRKLLLDLELAGIHTIRLVRRKPGAGEVSWNPETGLEPGALDDVDAVVHLAGENIAGRWTEEKKQRIRESRVHGTETLVRAMREAKNPPRTFVCASAIGIYGSRRGDEILTEASSHGNDFLAKVGCDWEAATEPAERAGIRTVLLRMGVVLSREGGALKPMLRPFRMGLGGRVGSGRQWMSWIAIDDVLAIVRFVLDTPGLRGAINVVAPNPVTNAQFTRALARVLRRPATIPLPAAMVRTLLGEMGDTLLLGSQRVLPRELEKAGYRFQHPQLEDALRHLLARKKSL